jgi:chloramphenicol-sensitive protein RarD
MRYSAAMADPARSDTGSARERAHARGLAFALGAYGCWGFLPIYFKLVAAAPPLELLAHRVLWALGLLVGLGWLQGGLREVREALRPGRTLALLAATTVLIAVNWLAYIWAVVNGRILEGSLGYFINPLVNVVLGVVVLKERLERPALVAVLVAATGVAWLTLQVGHPPWISITLALSFGLYGLLRKLVPVGAVTGLTVETLLLTPLAAGYLAWARQEGVLTFLARGRTHDLLLALAGPLTAVPLLLFTGAARRLPLTTLGLMQYLSPTLQLLVAVLLYHEPFTPARGVAFACIWAALAIFAVHSWRRGRPEPLTEA